MERETSTGKVRGIEVDGVQRYLGIPYARTPDLFGPPEPVRAWTGIRDATGFGPISPQPPRPPMPPPFDALMPALPVPPPGEEFLNVNVWTRGGAGRPVMVFIHGGSFIYGSNTTPTYDGTAFARDGVVLVSMNYRLGAPGFAVLPDAPSNRGLLDQLAALRWVRDNIAAFGGDPDNVTVFGESAGATSVAALVSAQTSTGLFRRAIVQSGSGSMAAVEREAATVAEALTDKLGASLRDVDVDTLMAAQKQVTVEMLQDPDPARWGESMVRGSLGLTCFFPVVDGDLLTRRPVDAIADGAGADVDLLLGTTSDEFRLFTVPSGLAQTITADTLPALLSRSGWDPSVADVYAKNRPDAGPGDVYTAILSDTSFRVPTVRIAEAHHGSSHIYEFAWNSPLGTLGACHALELPFVFDTLETGGALTGNDAPQRLADRVHAAWVSFAIKSDPGWATYEQGSRDVLTFDEPADQVVQDPRGDERALWDGVL